MAKLKYWQAVNAALREEMERDPSVCIVGEDVAYGGPFGATKDLEEQFGSLRVRNTPISEAGFVGAALGAAMTGMRPVVEVMFFDFVTLVMDQLVNQAAKISYMSGGKFQAPMVIRTLSGAGRGTGPQHGQNLEGWLAHVPGLKVVWSSTPEDAKGLLKSAIRDDDPVVVVESLGLWGQRGEVPDEDRLVPIGLGAIRREGEDATVVAWGSTVRRALEAAEQLSEEGIEAEVLDLRTLSPIDEALILSSLRKTGRLVIVHDAVAPFGPGAEVATIAASAGFGSLKAPVTRVAPPFAPVPFTPNLEQAYFPQPEDVRAAVSNLVNAKA